MIRRGKGFFCFGSRNNRRAQQAQLRANRSNHRWMSIFRQRQARFARWRQAFRPFVPLNMRRFQAIWMAFTGLLSGLINTVTTSSRPTALMANRAGMVRWGGKKKPSRRKRSTITGSTSVSYEALEDRKLLAADFGVTLSDPTIIEDFVDVESGLLVGGNAQATFTTDVPAVGDQVIEYQISGAATAPDFQIPLTGTITIPDGQTQAQLDIDVTPDFIFEGDEDFTISIVSVNDIAIAEFVGNDVTNDSDSNTIVDNETGAVISLTATDEHASEAPFNFPVDVDVDGNPVLTDLGGVTRTTPDGVLDEFVIDVFNNEYESIQVVGEEFGDGVEISVQFFFADGGPAQAAVAQPANGADVLTFDIDPDNQDRVLDTVQISVDTTVLDEFGGPIVGSYQFEALNGIAKGGNQGHFELALDTELAEDLVVVLDVSGVAELGVDYNVAVVGAGASFVAAADGSSITVTIEAGTTVVPIYLTTIDDTIVEGGFDDSPGIEDAVLTISAAPGGISGGSLASSVSIDASANSDVVKIEDNDFAELSITAGGNAAEAGEVSSEFTVSLNQTGNVGATGPTTSSEDVLVGVDVGGEAIFGSDYVTTFTADPGNSQDSAQPIGGFFSVAAGSTVAQNTVRRSAGLSQEDYFQIEVFNTGDLTVSVPASSSNIDAELTLRNADGDLLQINNPSTSRSAAIFVSDLAPGIYFISVSDNGSDLSASDFYSLDLSIENFFSTDSIDGFEGGVRVPAGEESTTFNIEPVNDNIVEGGTVDSQGVEDVDFSLTQIVLADPDISISSVDDATLSIVDDDAADLEVSTTNGVDPDDGETPTNGAFTLTLDAPSSTDTRVAFTINGFNTGAGVAGVENNDINATFGQDYTLGIGGSASLSLSSSSAPNFLNTSNGTGFLTIPAGSTSLTLVVDVINDDIIEDLEQISLTVNDIVSGDPDITLETTGPSIVNITDLDDSVVTIDNPAIATEGGLNGLFTVSLESPSDTDTDVNFQVVIPAPVDPASVKLTDFEIIVFDSSAAAGTPEALSNVLAYDPNTGVGTVRIPAHVSSAGIQIVAIDDTIVEATEDLTIELTGLTEENTVEAGFPDADITLVADPSGPNPSATIQVIDNDQAFVTVVSDGDAAEPGYNSSFTVSLVDADGNPLTTEVPVTVSFEVLRPSGSATPGDGTDPFNTDYLALSGSVTIYPEVPVNDGDPVGNGNSATIDVVVLDNDVNEDDETVDIRLTGTSSPTQFLLDSADEIDDDSVANEASLTIVDNDDVVVSIAAIDSLARETNADLDGPGRDDGRLAVTLSRQSDAPVVVNLSIRTDGGPNPDATQGSDFVLSTTQVTFAPFQTTAFVDVSILNDGELEQFIEQVQVQIDSIESANESAVGAGPSGLASTVSIAQVTVEGAAENDFATVNILPDPTVRIVAVDSAGAETDPEGLNDPRFRVELPTINGIGAFDENGEPVHINVDSDLTVTYEIGGDANEGDDFTIVDSGTVIIPQGDGFAYIEVDVIDDNIVEDLEFVSAQLKTVDAELTVDDDVEIASDLFSVSSSDGFLRRIDTARLEGLADGSTLGAVAITVDGVDANAGFGLAVNPVDHEVFAVVSVGASDSLIERALVSVDPATGIAELIGDLDIPFTDNDDFRSIAFDNDGSLFGITNLGGLYSINTTTAALTFVGALSDDGAAIYGDAIGFTPDGELFHGNNTVFENGDLDPVAGVLDDVNALEHAQNGNFADNAFFSVDINGTVSAGPDSTLLNLLTFDDETPSLDVVQTLVGTLDHAAEDIAFIKSNAFVTIDDNDVAFVEVKPFENVGEDNLNDTVDTGFTITLRQADGDTATVSDTDTVVSFEITNTATPFLGDQFESDDPSVGTALNPQNIDSFPSELGGAFNFSFNDVGLPATVLNGVGDGISGADYYSFTVLNAGDQILISESLGVANASLELIFEGSVVATGSVINFNDTAQGTYVLRVVADLDEAYSLDIAIENHLVADYELTSDGNNLNFNDDTGRFEVTVPANSESIDVNVEVFNDTQVEIDETVSLSLRSVVEGDADVNTGLVFFADSSSGVTEGIGTVDVGGGRLQQILNTGLAFSPSDSDPFGISIDADAGKVYFTEQDAGVQGIYRANLDGSGLEAVVLFTDAAEGVFEPRGVEVIGGFVYWVDEASDSLRRVSTDLSTPLAERVIQDIIVNLPEGSDLDDVAVDLENELVYFVDDGLDGFGNPLPAARISRVSIAGLADSSGLPGTAGAVQTVIQFSDELPGLPQSIALDAERGQLFYTDALNDSVVRVSNLDGSEFLVETLVEDAGNAPNGIAIDLVNDFVYWVSEGLGTGTTQDTVFRADISGSGPVVAEFVAETNDLLGTQNIEHIDLLIPTHLDATVQIVDTDAAEAFISTSNTEEEAALDPASEGPTDGSDGAPEHRDIVVSLRDANGAAVTIQNDALIEYTFLDESTASNAIDLQFLDGDVVIEAGTTNVSLRDTGVSNPNAVFVQNDALVEPTESVIVELGEIQGIASSIDEFSDGSLDDLNERLAITDVETEDTGFVLIEDNDSALVSVEATDPIAKERDGTPLPGTTLAADSQLDVVFIVDTSTSFSDELAAFQSQASLIASELTDSGTDALFGVASFEDFALGGFGVAGDSPFTQETGLVGLSDFNTAIAGLTTSTGNGDDLESQYAALFAALGNNLDVDGDGTVDSGTGGTFGFRTDAQTIFVLWTDAEFHNSDIEAAYPGPGAIETTFALQQQDVRVIGINSQGAAQTELEALANATGAVNEDGDPLVFDITSDGTEIASSILDVANIIVGDGEPINSGQFKFSLTETSSTDTIVQFKIDALVSDVEPEDFFLTAGPANNLTFDAGAGIYSITIPQNQFDALLTVNVVDDLVIESDEVLAIEIVEVLSPGDVSVDNDADSDAVIIFDDDLARVVIANNGDATESTQPGNNADFPLATPGENGQFTVSLVDLDGNLTTSETETQVRVLLDAISTATFGEDFTIPGFVDISDDGEPAQYAGVITFAPGVSQVEIDVILLTEDDGVDNPSDPTDDDNSNVDLGDEIVRLALDTTFGDTPDPANADEPFGPDGREDDGVIGDAQIELDVPEDEFIVFEGATIDVDGESVEIWPSQTVVGTGGNTADVTINDETFVIRIVANEENASEPGLTEAGSNGQFTISIDNPFQFADTTVFYTISGTAQTGVDFEDLDGFTGNGETSFTGQIVIPAGQSSVLLDVNVIDDDLIESFDPETVTVTLTGVGSSTANTLSGPGDIEAVRRLSDDPDELAATVNIFDDDTAVATPSVGTNDDGSPIIVSESAVGGNGEFVISLLDSDGELIENESPTTVTFVIGGTATLGSDFVLAAAPENSLAPIGSTANPNDFTIVIPAGATSVPITVVTLDDFILENDETVTLTVTAVDDGGYDSDDQDISASAQVAELVIQETDEAELVVTATDPGGPEGDPGIPPNGTGSFTFSLVQRGTATEVSAGTPLVSDTNTNITFTLSEESTAISGVDFAELVNEIVLPANAASVTIPVNFIADELVEDDETIIISGASISDDPANVDSEKVLEIVGPDDVNPGRNTATVTIENDDSSIVTISSDAEDGGIAFANEFATDGRFVVQLSAPSDTDTRVDYVVLPSSTATAGVDFTLTDAGVDSNPFAGFVIIPAGETTAEIDVSVIDDAIAEGDETVNLSISLPTDARDEISVGAENAATVTIAEDNDVPVFSVLNTSANEGDGTVTFTITLTGGTFDVPVEVALDLQGGTATGVSIDPPTTNFDDEVSDQDFDSDNTNSVTFLPGGSTVQTIDVAINEDNFVELNETFTAELFITGSSLDSGLEEGRDFNFLDAADNVDGEEPEFGTATIVDNDTATFTIFALDSNFENNDPVVNEGTNDDPLDISDTTFTLVDFVVELSNPIDTDVDVSIFLGGGTATGFDFESPSISDGLLPFGTDFDNTIPDLMFEEGDFDFDEMRQQEFFSVRVVQDSIVEGGPLSTGLSFGSETFIASIDVVTDSDEGSSEGNSIGDRAFVDDDTSTATILDRDSAASDSEDVATITIEAIDSESGEPIEIPENGGGTFRITQSDASSTTTTVTFQVGGDASIGADFNLSSDVVNNLTALGGGLYSIEIPASSFENEVKFVDIEVSIVDDDLIEDDEQLSLTLVEVIAGDPQVSLADESQSAIVQIDGNDAAFVSVASEDDQSFESSPEGGDNGTFVITLSDQDEPGTIVSDTDTEVFFEIDITPSPDDDSTDLTADDFRLRDSSGAVIDTDVETRIDGSVFVVGSVIVPASSFETVIEVEPVDDVLPENVETLTLRLVDVDGNADIELDTNVDNLAADVDINDNGDGLTVNAEFVRDGAEVTADPGGSTGDEVPVGFEIVLRDANGDRAIVPIGSTGLEDGESAPGLFISYTIIPSGDNPIELGDNSDIVSPSFTTVIAEGQSSVFVDIDVVDDLEIEGPEGLTIQITGIGSDELNGEVVTIGDATEDALIIDNDTDFAVTSVKVSSSQFSDSFNTLIDEDATDGFAGFAIGTGDDQNDTVPFVNIDQLVVTFTEAIDSDSLTTDNFILHGLNETPEIVGFEIDESGTTVRLELDGTVINDRLQLEIRDSTVSESGSNLNGEFVNDESGFASGDGETGGDFRFNFNVLPGNTTDFTVPDTAATNAFDAGAIFFAAAGGSLAGLSTADAVEDDPDNLFLDLDGNGFINAFDAGFVFGFAADAGLAGLRLPNGTPGGGGPNSFSRFSSSSDSDNPVGSVRFSVVSSSGSELESAPQILRSQSVTDQETVVIQPTTDFAIDNLQPVLAGSVLVANEAEARDDFFAGVESSTDSDSDEETVSDLDDFFGDEDQIGLPF